MSAHYYSAPYYSNSSLSWIKRNCQNIVMNPEALAFGTKIDEQLFNAEDGDEETKKYLRTIRASQHFSAIQQHPDSVPQYEWYGEFYGLPWKCMYDTLVPTVIVQEFKTCKVSSHAQLLQLIDRLDYDRQVYVYMETAQVPVAQIIGLTKHKIPLVFQHYVKRGDLIWDSGKRKTEYYIEILKSMIV